MKITKKHVITYAKTQEFNMKAPLYLYKILSKEDWIMSQSNNSVRLPSADKEFIHLSTEDQLDKILDKYWKDTPGYVVLKIEATKLLGKLVLEANPGGVNKYYHLYNGSIPFEAIVKVG